MNQKSYVSPAYVSPEDCPLCGNKNHCANLSPEHNEPCWCATSEITFPESLLTKVTDAAKNKACICKACAEKHNQQSKRDLSNDIDI